MSYIFDGKVSNQTPECENFNTPKTACGKCGTLLEFPERHFVKIGTETYATFSYLNTPFFIYETKRGKAVVYCSGYCRKKHNHRFR